MREINYIAVKDPVEEARLAALLTKDFSEAKSLDEMYDSISTVDIRNLYKTNPSFKVRADELQRQEFINNFRALPEAAQQRAFQTYNAEQKALIDADYNAFEAEQAVPVVPTETLAETFAKLSDDEIQKFIDADPAGTTEQGQVAAQTKAARAEASPVVQVAPEPAATTPITAVEDLYDGIEKLGEGSYKLTVDPADGSNPEIFYGTSQKECFKALKKSKARATAELRRRMKAVEITDALRALKVEVLNYPPPLKPLPLTADEIFTLTEQQKDATTVLEATRKLRLASLSPEECARENERIERQRISDQYNTANTWVNTHDDFYNHPHNIEQMQKLMAGLNWAVTINNLDLAFKTLKDQGALLDLPEEDPSTQPPVVQPASVVPVTIAAPAVPAAVVPAIPVTPVATPTQALASALPAAPKVLRPGSSSTSVMPTRRIESVSTAPAKVVLTVEMYNQIPAAEAKRRYLKDPDFKAAFDQLCAEGKI